MSMVTEEEVREALKQVYDPEIGMDIVSLGLVYGIERHEEDGTLIVRHTLTTPACPLGPIIQTQAQAILSKLDGVKNVKLELVWDPPWDPRIMCSDEVKMELGIF
jgi:metal-sulfur cluster biosynthetic enzyme